MTDFDARNWYWTVGADATRAYSSATGSFVSANDVTFVAWVAAGNAPSPIDSVSTLGAYLVGVRARPVDVGVLAAYQSALTGAIDAALLRIDFNHENRIRALESKAPITQQQFTAAVAALL